MPYNIIIGRDETDKKRFGDKGLIFLGKGYVTIGHTLFIRFQLEILRFQLQQKSTSCFICLLNKAKTI